MTTPSRTALPPDAPSGSLSRALVRTVSRPRAVLRGLRPLAVAYLEGRLLGA